MSSFRRFLDAPGTYLSFVVGLTCGFWAIYPLLIVLDFAVVVAWGVYRLKGVKR